MRKPKHDRRYILVRAADGRIEEAEFTRFADESVFIVAEGYVTCIEGSPGAWEEAWVNLTSRGFVELREARAEGLVPKDWEPSY